MRKLLVIFIASFMYCVPSSAQTCPTGGVIFSNQIQVNDFPTVYPGCTEISGNVLFGSNVDSLNALSQLTKIAGNFEIVSGSGIVDLTGLDNITEIGGNIYVNGSSLVSLDGFESLEKVGGNITIQNSPLESVEALTALDTIIGDFTLNNNQELTSLEGLNSLKYVGDQLRLHSLPRIKNMEGLDSLNYVDELYINDNDSLLSLKGFHALSIINYDLTISNHERLNSLAGIENLDSINGLTINISWNDSLTSICGLEQVVFPSLSYLTISNNALLSQCEIQSVCDYLNAASGGNLISGNATGCQFESEVLANCATGNSICCELLIDTIDVVDSDCINNNGSIQVFTTCASCDTLEYSLDNSTWQSESLFDNLAPGNYQIFVRDSVNISCNTSQNNITVNIETDTISPISQCQSIVAHLDSMGYYELSALAIDAGSTDNCAVDSLWTDVDTLLCGGIGDNTVKLYVQDASNNIDSCSSTVTLMDTIGPAMVCVDTLAVTLDSLGQSTLTAAQLDNGSTDNCTAVNFSMQPAQLDCGHMGFEDVILMGADTVGNVAECTAVVEVKDTIPPMVTCKDLTVNLGQEPFVVLDTVVGSGNDALKKSYAIEEYGVNAVGDIDNDSDFDILIASSSRYILVLKNDGTGNFTVDDTITNNYGHRNLQLDDLDGDGDSDLFVDNYYNFRVFINDGSGNFGDSGTQYSSNEQAGGVVDLGDLDGDGDLDVYVGTIVTSSNSVWINDGNGNFTLNSQIPDLTRTYDVELGDLDGDFDLDVVEYNTGFFHPETGEYIDGYITIRLNDGAGNFSGIAYEIGNGDRVVLVDYDRDNDLDIYGIYSGLIYTNDGSANFSSGSQFIINNCSPYNATLGDLDNDGLLELYESASYYSSYWSTYCDGDSYYGIDSNGNVNELNLGLDFISSIDSKFYDFNGDGLKDILFRGVARRISSRCYSWGRRSRRYCHSSSVPAFSEVWLNQPKTSVVEELSDNCNPYDLAVSVSQDTFDTNDVGLNMVTVTATDQSGNSGSCISKVRITDCGCHPDSSPLIPNTVTGTTTADCKAVDGDFTHYCDTQGRLLLSIDSETAQSIAPAEVSIQIQSGGFYYSHHCGNVPGGAHTGDCFISNAEGTVILCRTWDVDSDSTDAVVRYYFNEADIDILNAEIYTQGLTPITGPEQLWFYKVKDANGHAKPEDLDASDIVLLDNDGTNVPSETNWSLGTIPNGYFAEYDVASFSGGGGGIAHKGASAVCPPIEVEIEGDGQADSLGIFSYAVVHINGGTPPYEVRLSSGFPQDSMYSGDTLVFELDFALPELFIVSVIDSSGCPASDLNSIIPLFYPNPDSIAPVAQCRDASIGLDTFGMAVISPDTINNGSTDNDSLFFMELDYFEFDCTHIGAHLVELTVYDLAGNSHSCLATVTIEDPMSACCADNRNIHVVPPGFNTYFARNIFSDAILQSGFEHDIHFRAENSIELMPGFEVSQSALFEALQQDCP